MFNDSDQWVTQSDIAKAKQMSLQLLSYHLEKPDAPKPVLHYGRKLYRADEVNNWRPVRDNRGRKKQ